MYSMRFAGGMTYRVEFAERAARDLNLLYVEKHATDSTAAARWYNRLEKAVYSLESSPYRCPVAPEQVYRIIHEIDERRKLVFVLTIRHGTREPAELDE